MPPPPQRHSRYPTQRRWSSFGRRAADSLVGIGLNQFVAGLLAACAIGAAFLHYDHHVPTWLLVIIGGVLLVVLVIPQRRALLRFARWMAAADADSFVRRRNVMLAF